MSVGPAPKDEPARQVFPRRDAEGRVISLAEALMAVLGGALVSLAALALVDGIFALLGSGTFGTASGWLALVLPIFLFVDDFRAWRTAGVRRIVVALIAVGAALPIGLVAANLASSLPGMVSGAIGAGVLGVLYTFVWFVGIRFVTGHVAEGESR